MLIVIRGVDKTDYIKSLDDEEMVAAYYEEIKDHQPVGEESLANWKKRNSELLAAMLSVLAEDNHDDGSSEAPSKASEELQKLSGSLPLRECEIDESEACEGESGYSEMNVFYYG